MRQSAVCLVAGGALLLATAAGPPSHTPLAVPAVALVMLALVRWRGRPLVAWIGPATRFVVRPRRASAGHLALLSPDATVTTVEVSGASIGALADRHGLAALLELGESEDLVRVGGLRLPAPTSLVGSPRDESEPAVTVQVLVVRHGTHQRAFVVVRVGADGRAWPGERLRPALAAAVRGVSRRLDRLGVSGRPLGPAGIPAAVAWAVEGTPGSDATTVEEAWDHLRIDAALHTTVRLHLSAAGSPGSSPHGPSSQRGASPHGPSSPHGASPHAASGPDGDALGALLGLPATVAALSSTADSAAATDEMLLRLAAPTPAALAAAVAAAIANAPGDVTHLDGAQLDAFTATLPVGRPAIPTGPGQISWRPEGGVVTIPTPGLKLGLDRHGEPVTLRLDRDRSAPVRLAVVGGPAAARVLGARVRALAPPAPVDLAVFDRPTVADTAALSTADVVVCQRVSPEEAALIAAALRLTQAGVWLSRIEGDMVAVIADGTVRWAVVTAPSSDLPLISGLSALART